MVYDVQACRAVKYLSGFFIYHRCKSNEGTHEKGKTEKSVNLLNTNIKGVCVWGGGGGSGSAKTTTTNKQNNKTQKPKALVSKMFMFDVQTSRIQGHGCNKTQPITMHLKTQHRD